MSAKIIGSGRSAVAAAAYRSAEKLHGDRDGRIHDYTRKGAVVHKELMALSDAPSWVRDRQKLWNRVEAAEKRKDAQLAREVEVALPAELSRPQQIELVRDYVQQEFVSRGMVADVAVHDKGDGNPHAHILLTTRSLKNGAFGKKDRTWNDRKLLTSWRKEWEIATNRGLERAGLQERVDCRSLKDQGLERLPTKHLGHVNAAQERKFGNSIRGDFNREVVALNHEIEVINFNIRNAEIFHRLERVLEKAELRNERPNPKREQSTGAAEKLRSMADFLRKKEKAQRVRAPQTVRPENPEHVRMMDIGKAKIAYEIENKEQQRETGKNKNIPLAKEVAKTWSPEQAALLVSNRVELMRSTLQTHKDVVQYLKSEGFGIAEDGKKQMAITILDGGRQIKLDGRMFRKDWAYKSDLPEIPLKGKFDYMAQDLESRKLVYHDKLKPSIKWWAKQKRNIPFKEFQRNLVPFRTPPRLFPRSLAREVGLIKDPAQAVQMINMRVENRESKLQTPSAVVKYLEQQNFTVKGIAPKHIEVEAPESGIRLTLDKPIFQDNWQFKPGLPKLAEPVLSGNFKFMSQDIKTKEVLYNARLGNGIGRWTGEDRVKERQRAHWAQEPREASRGHRGGAGRLGGGAHQGTKELAEILDPEGAEYAGHDDAWEKWRRRKRRQIGQERAAQDFSRER